MRPRTGWCTSGTPANDSTSASASPVLRPSKNGTAPMWSRRRSSRTCCSAGAENSSGTHGTPQASHGRGPPGRPQASQGGGGAPVRAALQQRAQRRVVLRARRAALEVGGHPRDGGLGGGPRELELDEVVELVEADLARHLRPGRAEHAGEAVARLVAHREPPSESSGSRPCSASWARSLRRASWSVL